MLKLLDKFKGMASVLVKDGASCLFWDDCWQGPPLKLAYLELYSFVKKSSISLKRVTVVNDVSSLFSLPLSVQAYGQFQQVQVILQDLQHLDGMDTWTYIWGSSIFTSKKAYCQLSGSSLVHPVFKWLWKSSCQHNHKVFFWLLLQDRLSTRNILRRKHMHLPSYSCVLCSMDAEETVHHLFLECEMARTC
jgi:hypothetical protein